MTQALEMLGPQEQSAACSEPLNRGTVVGEQVKCGQRGGKYDSEVAASCFFSANGAL